MVALSEFDGISERHLGKLREVGIVSSDDLLDYGAGRKGRAELSKITRLGPKRIQEWIKRADVVRVPGVSVKYSNLLEAAGIDTVKMLRRRNPERLHDELVAINERRNIVGRPPSLAEVERWVEGSKELPNVLRRW